MASPTVVIKFLGDASDALAATKKIDSEAAASAKRLQKVGVALSAAITLPLVAAGAAAFHELESAGKVAAQTNAVIKSTGGVANVTAAEVQNLATALSRKSGVDDEAIASGSNLLLTFTKIRDEAGKGNDIFTRATETALDLSVALGKDMTQSSLMLGKALNDPVKGVTALGKAGVQFTAEQKATIASLVETGDVLAAQKIILKEVETQVGGSAAAYGDTLAGKVSRARETMLNTAAALVGTLAPALEAAAGLATKLADVFGALPKPVAVAVTGFALLAAGLGPLLTLLGNVQKISHAVHQAFTAMAVAADLSSQVVRQWGASLVAAAGPIAIFVAAIAAVVAVGIVLNNVFGGSAKSWKELAAEGQKLGQSLVTQASQISDLTARHDQLTASMRDLKARKVENLEEAIKLKNAYDVLKGATQELETQQAAAKVADEQRAAALAKVANGTRDFKNATDETRTAIENLNNTVLASQSALLAYDLANINVAKAEREAAAAAAIYGAGSEEARIATNALEQAKLTAAGATFELAKSEADLTAIQKSQGIPGLISLRDTLIKTSEAHGGVTAATQAQIDKINFLIGAANAVPPEKGVKVTADTKKAHDDLDAVNRKADEITRPRWLRISVETMLASGGGSAGWSPMMAGGLVPGPRTRPFPAILHGGEMVVPAAQAAAMQRGFAPSTGGTGSGPTFNIDVRVEAGVAPAEVGAMVIDKIRAYERVAGTAWRTR